jgi:hypothetical protein
MALCTTIMEGMMARAVVVDELIYRNGISMKMEKVRSNPFLPGNGNADGAKHFKFRLSSPGRDVDVYLSFDSAEVGEMPTLSDVLLMLAMDASGCRLLEGYETWGEELTSVFGGSDGNLKEIQDFWYEYHGRRKQSERVRGFLGDSAYEELLD